MPKKRTLEEGAQAPADAVSGFSQMLQAPIPEVAQASEPILVRSAHESVRAPDLPDRPRVDALDSITKALGVPYWRSNPVYDWCRQPSGFRHRFTRYYFSVPEADVKLYVLVDIFASNGQSIEKEVAQKSAAITQENARRAQRGEAPIGYLPIVRGATVPFEVFDAVRSGQIVGLQVKRDLTAVQA